MAETKCRNRLPFGEDEVEVLQAHLKTLYGDYASDLREILSWYATTLANTRDELETLRVAVKLPVAPSPLRGSRLDETTGA